MSHPTVGELECGRVRIHDTVMTSCPVEWKVVIVQPSQAQAADWMLDAAESLVNVVLAKAGRVGVVEYSSDDARVIEPLTNDRLRLQTAIRRPGMGGCMCGNEAVEDAANRAVRLLTAERATPASELVVLFGASKNSPDPRSGARLEDAAHAVTLNDIPLLVGCPQAPTQPYCAVARTLPTDVADYSEPPDRLGLSRRLEWHMARGFDGVDDISEIVVRHEVSPELHFVTDSAVPVPIDVRASITTELTWRWSSAEASGGVTLTYLADTLVAGSAAIRSSAVMTDQHGSVSASAAVTETLVRPCPIPTSTASPTSETATPETPPPTETATATATTTPPPLPRPIYLPVLINEVPCTRPALMDVALVLDVSSSMLQESPSKLSRATEAIRAFLDRLDRNDQAALVTFAAEATVLQPLSEDTALVSQALDNLVVGETTRLDLGVMAAHGELVGPLSRSAAAQVMVILTDGVPNPVPATVALDKASAARQDGISVFTIGLGRDVDGELLRAMASLPEWYYEAPTADDLLAIYSGLPEYVPCGPEAYWPRLDSP
jgi:Mg-chelatase subunit ChlD